jgi:hypothetical protein
MAYFIFLKSLSSLGEFRKSPHIKIPPKSPCANFQSLGIFKKSNFIRKRIFPVTFSPSGLSAQSFFYRPIFPPLSIGPRPSGRPSPPARPNRPPFFFLPHQSRARTASPPAGLAPPPRSPRSLHRKRKMAASNPPSFHPINRRHSPPLQSRKLAPSTLPLKLLQASNFRCSALPRLASAL